MCILHIFGGGYSVAQKQIVQKFRNMVDILVVDPCANQLFIVLKNILMKITVNIKVGNIDLFILFKYPNKIFN